MKLRSLSNWFRKRSKINPFTLGTTHDVAHYPIQRGADLYVYWKSLDEGKGPSASFFVLGEEVLRFDCFGENRGHYHMNLENRGHRRRNWASTTGLNSRKIICLYFPEKTVSEQIERSAFELTTNVRYYLWRNRDKKIKTFSLDENRLREAVAVMKSKMLEYHHAIPELQDSQ